MIGRVRESRNPKKVIRVSLRESYGEIRRVPVNLLLIDRKLVKQECTAKEKNGFLKSIITQDHFQFII